MSVALDGLAGMGIIQSASNNLTHAPVSLTTLAWVHVLASLGFAGSILGLAPLSGFQGWSRLSFFLFALPLSLAIPVFGMLGMVVAVLPALKPPTDTTKDISAEPRWQHLDATRLPPNNQVQPERARNRLPNTDDIMGILLHSQDTEKRIRALIACLKLPEKAAVKILRLALRDPEDDVRLLAYSLLDRKEKVITETIRAKLSQLQSPLSPSQEYRVHASVAQAYWDMADLGLGQGETLNYMLQAAREHIQLAMEKDPERPYAYFLCGKIDLRRNELELALFHFKCAQQLGFAPARLAPYLAELKFLQGLRDNGATDDHHHAQHGALAVSSSVR